MRMNRLTVLALSVLLVAASSAFAQLGSPPSPEDFAKKFYKSTMPGDDSAYAARLVFGMAEVKTTKDLIKDKGAPRWTYSTLAGDAAVLKAYSAEYSLKKDYPDGSADAVTHENIARYIGSYRFNTTSKDAFEKSKADLVAFANNHRKKRFFSAGLPMFAVPFGPQPADRIAGCFQLFDTNLNPTPVQPAPKNGVLDYQALTRGVLDCYKTTDSSFFSAAGIEVSRDGDKVWYKFPGDSEQYRFEVAQILLFQKKYQGTPGRGAPNPNPERFTTTAGFDGWNRPPMKDGLTTLDQLSQAEVNEMKAALDQMIASGKYEVKTSGGAAPNGANPEFKPVDMANLNSWTVEHTVPALESFDPGLEGDSSIAKEARKNASFQDITRTWMEVVTFAEGKIFKKSNDVPEAAIKVGPYMYTQYVYVSRGLNYLPANLEQAQMVQGVAANPPRYQPTDGDFGTRQYATPNINVEFGDDAADFSGPVRMYRGFPKLGSGEKLVGADENGILDLSDQVNQDSTLCMNMALSLATRYRYNPDPNAPKPPPPPADPAQHQAWLDTHFPVCISYYPPYKNNKDKIIGPYVRLAGPIGAGDCGKFPDDRYASCVRIPGEGNLLMGSLYRPIRLEGELLKIVNLLALPADHPFGPKEDASYNAGAIAASPYRFAWKLEFDPNSSDDQGTGVGQVSQPGFACEVIRIPLKPPRLQFESEILPIDPRLPTMEQRDADGMVHKALLDAKLLNGPELGSASAPEPDTGTPGYGRNNFVYAVVGQCCGPTVLLQATMAQGNRVKTIGGTKQQVGPRPNCVVVIESEQASAGGNKQEEALGIPAGFDAPVPADFGPATGSAPLKGDYSNASISSRMGDDYRFGAYTNLAPEIGFDKGAPAATNAANPSDAKGKSFLEAQGVYVENQRYFLDVCAETAVAPQMVKDASGANVIAYFVKQMKLEIIPPGPDGKVAPTGTPPEIAKVLYNVDNLAKPPSTPPCTKHEFVPRQVGEYTLVTTIRDFNDITRVTRMKLPVRESGVDVNAINKERERK